MNSKLLSILKFICIIYLVIFLPRFFSNKSFILNSPKKSQDPCVNISSIQNMVHNSKDFGWIKNLNLALVCNQKDSINFLSQNGFKVPKVFLVDPKSKKLQNFNLQNLSKTDAIVFDMLTTQAQDNSCFESLNKVIKVASASNKKLIIIDNKKENINLGDKEGVPSPSTGELAIYLNKYILKKPANLTIVR